MFSAAHDQRNRVFVQFAKEHGVRELARRVLENQRNGIRYGYRMDYDGLQSEEQVCELLEKGKKMKG